MEALKFLKKMMEDEMRTSKDFSIGSDEEFIKKLSEAIAELEALQSMYKDIAEYEHLVGYKVNDSFKLGWDMGRAKLNEFDNWEA